MRTPEFTRIFSEGSGERGPFPFSSGPLATLLSLAYEFGLRGSRDWPTSSCGRQNRFGKDVLDFRTIHVAVEASPALQGSYLIDTFGGKC